MSGNQTELKQLLDFAVRVAREAGEITNRYFKGSYIAECKADLSLVTVADREAERHIREAIQRAFPDDGILGEEETENVGSSNRRWIVDPVDGTFSFVHGVPLYAVLIGLEVDGDPGIRRSPGCAGRQPDPRFRRPRRSRAGPA